MYLFLGAFTGLEPSTIVYTNKATIFNTSLTGDTLTTSSGQIVVNGSQRGNSTTVFEGDEVELVLSSPSEKGRSLVVYLTQAGQRAGYCVVSSKALESVVFDTRYENLFAFDSVDPWIPDPTRLLHKLALNGSPLATLDLNTDIVESDYYNVVTAVDYHRNEVLVLDTDTFSVAKRLSDGTGPADVVQYYSSVTSERTYTIVAYNKSGTVALYDADFGFIRTYPNVNASYLLIVGNILYVGHKGEATVSTYTITTSNTLTAGSNITFSAAVTAMFMYNNEPHFCVGTTVVNKLKETVLTLPFKVRSVSVRETTSFVYFSHGEFGQLSKADMDTKNVSTRTIANSLFLNTIYVRPDGQMFIFDTEAKTGYLGTFDSLSSIQTTYAPYGVLLSDSLYLLDLYDTLPKKVVLDTLEYTLDRTAFVNNEEAPPGTTLSTGKILIESNRPIFVQPVVSSDTATILYNNVPRGLGGFYVDEVSTLALSQPITYATLDPSVLGYIIGDTYVETLLTVNNVDVIPDTFHFEPKFNVALSATTTSDILTITGLEAPIQLTSTGIIIVNGIEAVQPATVNNGATVQLKTTSSDLPGYPSDIILTINDQFSTVFSFITESIKEEPTLLPIMAFEDTYDNPLSKLVYSATIFPEGEFEPIELRIPTLYDASIIINGTNLGKTATLRAGDSIQLSINTTYNRDAPHIVPLVSDYSTYYWLAWTAGDTMPGPFDFGTIQGLGIKDYVTSNIVNPTGISKDANITIRVPYGCFLYVDGERQSATTSLDYRGMPLSDYFIRVKIGPLSDLVLKGYPRTQHGSIHKLPVYIGGRKGYWTLETYALDSLKYDSLGHIEKLISGTAVAVYGHDLITVNSTRNVEVHNSADIVEQRKLNAVVTNADSIVIPSRSTVVTKSDSIVIPARTAIASNSLVTVDYVPVWDFLKSTILYALDRQVMTVNPGTLEFAGFTLAVITPDTRHEWVPDTSWGIFSNSTHTISYTPSYVNESSSILYFDKLQEFEVVSNTFVHFDRGVSPELEAILFGSNYLVFDSMPYEVRTESRWTVNPLKLYGAEVFNYSDNLLFKVPYKVEVDAPRPSFSSDYIVVVTPLHEFAPDFGQLYGSNQIEFLPKYESSYAESIYTFKPKIEVFDSNAFTEFYPNITSDTTNKEAYFKLDVHVETANLNEVEINAYSPSDHLGKYPFNTSKAITENSNYLVFEAKTFIETTTTESASYATLPFLEVVTSFERTPLAGVTHPGYFDTYQDAVDNAHLWGKEDGEYYVATMPDKGFIWIVTMPCENMCRPNDCPPHGYIHGG